MLKRWVCLLGAAMLVTASTSACAQKESAGQPTTQAVTNSDSTELTVQASELNLRIAQEMVKQAKDGSEDFGPVVDDLKSFVSGHPGTAATEDVLSYAAGRFAENYYTEADKRYAIEFWLDYLDQFPKGQHRNEAIAYLTANNVPLPGK